MFENSDGNQVLRKPLKLTVGPNMSKGSSPPNTESNGHPERTLPSIRTANNSGKEVAMSPSPMADDSGSLNDDLVSVYSSANRTEKFLFSSGRLSVDSASVRRSFDSSSVWGKQGRLYAPGSEIHSGSMEFSPLGNNSIYELVMNTRRKNWLRHPTTDEIPPVVLSKVHIPESWRESTSVYVDEIKPSYETFERTNNLETIKGFGRLQLDEIGRDGELSNGQNEPENGQFVRQGNKGALDTVPQFYFDENFKLDDSHTFREIIDDIDLQLDHLYSESSTDRESFYQEIEERLSSYLDCIETLLVTEISRSSNSFFFALEDVEKIESKAASAVEKLSKLSQKLKEADSEQVQSRISILKKMIRRKNVEKLEQGLLQAKLILQLVENCKNLYNKRKFEDCLDMIGHVNNMLKGDDDNDPYVQDLTRKWPYKLSDLDSAAAFASTKEYLANALIEIGGSYSIDLSDVLLNDIRSTYNPANEIQGMGLKDTSSSFSKKDTEKDTTLAQTIKPLITNLIRCEELASSFELYSERFIAELKGIIKEFLPKSQESDGSAADRSTDSKAPGSGSKLSRLLRDMTPSEFQQMVITIFAREVQAFWRLSRHQKILLDVGLGAITTKQGSGDSALSNAVQLDINPAFHEGIRTVQLRMGKIIAVRRDLSCKLRYDHFLELCGICFWFDRECETITGEFLTKYLRDVMTMQIKNYIASLNSKNLQTIRHGIDEEKWTPFIVDSDVQRDVNDIVACGHMSPSKWLSFMDLSIKPPEEAEPESSSGTSKGHKKSVVVNDKTFVASNALLTTIGMLKGVLVLAVNLPTQFLSITEKMCYDLIMYFNGRAMASVCGPDGTPSTKNGKNLSILGESLDCLAEFAVIVQSIYQRLGSGSKDFEPLSPSAYSKLLQTFQTSSDKLYQAHAPPPPV
ncbi:Vps54p [Lachancea thermotolerans CBS 6340]|uniref:KLTH0C07678p n=1 Tax=Lachancea thermotolerans (strain ATCC 56472 / CBS 6340 / NRRL Y-8284) TaxID=559295 RepID=C5DEA8_LACTC|nr:KLTH0C07678p [Lachancea thermotolerans CBS 6340]CAR22119.1 KLTH0C07678p [Lachancea thermotolerans CBS 6340]